MAIYYSDGHIETFNDFEEEVAAAEARVAFMLPVGSVRRLECSQWMGDWDDPDMDTTETLYRNWDAKSTQFRLRIEQYHAFMLCDDVEDITRKEAEAWVRKNARNAWQALHTRKRQIANAK